MRGWIISSVLLAVVAANVLYLNEPTGMDYLGIATLSAVFICGYEFFVYQTEDYY